MITSGC